MDNRQELFFGRFRLDLENERLWRRNKNIRLQPKAFALLRHFVEHPDQLVTKQSLLETIWPGVYVTDAVLTVCIKEVRKALNDSPKEPQFIETVHRRGYRFVASVSRGSQPSRNKRVPKASSEPAATTRSQRKIPTEASSTIGALSLVGREIELSFLRQRVDSMLEGKGGAVFITGPAGIGKTRLAREAREYAQKRGSQWLEGKYEKSTSEPYYAWTNIMRSYLQRNETTSLQTLVGPYGAYLAKIVPEAMEKPIGTSTAVREDAQSERLRLFDALTQFVVQVSRETPLVVFLDDLQWADSIEPLRHMASRIQDVQILVLAAYREDQLKEDSGLWQIVLDMNRERLFYSLRLRPLERIEVEQFISSVLRGGAGPPLVDMIYTKTGGNPFFVEEFLRLLLDSKAIVFADTGWELIDQSFLKTPESVKTVITERLGRLGTHAHELLKIASVIGRDFSLTLLNKLVGYQEETIVDLLDSCESSHLITSQLKAGEETYTFSHDLMQESLYESIGPARRRRQHLLVGQALEKLNSGTLEEHYDALAYHFNNGTDVEKAFTYSQLAGRRASAQFAYGKAAKYFEQVLEALEQLTDGQKRIAEAIDLRLELCVFFHVIGDFKKRYERLREAEALAENLGDHARLARVLCAMTAHFTLTADSENAILLGQRVLGLLTEQDDVSVNVVTRFLMGLAYHNLGDYHRAREMQEQALEFVTLELQHELLGASSPPSVTCRSWLVLGFAQTGEFDKGVSCGYEAIRIAEGTKHAWSIAYACSCVGTLFLLKGDLKEAIAISQRALNLCKTYNIPGVAPLAASPLGYALALSGETNHGLTRLREAVEQSKSMQRLGRQSLRLTWLSEAYLLAGCTKEAKEAADLALQLSRQHKERGHYAWVLKLFGEIYSIDDQTDLQKAEFHYRQAITLASELGMRPLEAHCHRTLGTLYINTGRMEQARAELSVAVKMYKSMKMTFWLSKAKVELFKARRKPLYKQ
jgi:DNA-binding winged helix-turn-helix (wHTH) protein/tetratricopeptide (TPR) repeat protein